MKLDLDRFRRQYHRDGVTRVPDVVPREVAGRWLEKAMDLCESLGRARDYRAGEADILGDGGENRYVILDGLAIRDHFPDMPTWYVALQGLVSAVTFADVTVSPYERSGMSILVYRGTNASQSWHFDSNPITALLYLTTNTEGATECRLLHDIPDKRKGRLRRIFPVSGSLLLMQGRRVWHRGTPVHREVKVACPWNYYTATDTWRPEGMDELIYGPDVKARP